MKIRINFNMDTASFKDNFDYEIEQILLQAIKHLQNRESYRNLIDSNGSVIGSVRMGKV